MKKKYHVLILIAFCIILVMCAEDDAPPLNYDLIFNNSYPIKINAYEFSDEGGNIYHIQADTNFALQPDTVNDLPVLAWDSLPFKIVSVALFSEAIIVRGDEIENTDDIVWQWHSGMDFESYGRVQFSEGRNVVNGIIDYENSPDPLPQGSHYWAVWAWGNAGVRILFSSKQREFYVVK